MSLHKSTASLFRKRESVALFFSLFAVALFVFAPAWWRVKICVVAALIICSLYIAENICDYYKSFKSITPTIRWRIFFNIFALIVVITLSCLALAPVLSGDRLLKADHNVHYTRAWLIGEQLRHYNQLWGWSDHLSAGFPTAIHYPIGVDLLLLAFTFPEISFLSLDHIYGLGVLFALILQGVAIYFLGARAFNPSVGLLAALFALGDPGSFDTGGWNWNFSIGVWPSAFSVSLMLCALLAFDDLIRKGSWRAGAAGSVLLGAALMCHPIEFFHILTIVGVSIVYWFFLSEHRSSKSSFFATTLFFILGAMIACLYLLPFFSYSTYAEIEDGSMWFSLEEIVSNIFTGKLIDGTVPLICSLGLIGMIISSVSLSPLRFIIGMIPLTLILCASTEFVSLFNNTFLSEKLSYVRFSRFPLLIRPYLFIAAAALLVSALQPVLYALYKRLKTTPLIRTRIMTSSLLLLIVLSMVGGINQITETPVLTNELMYREDRSYKDELNDIIQYLQSKREQDPQRAIRVAAIGYELTTWHAVTDFGLEENIRLLPLERIPAFKFVYMPFSLDEKLFSLLGINYLISEEEQFASFLEFVMQFGNLKLYQIVREEARTTFFNNGSATIEVISQQDNLIHLSISQISSPEATLVLPVSYFPGWHAQYNGKEIPIEESTIEPVPLSDFVTISLQSGPGEYILQYYSGAPERWAAILFAVGIFTALSISLFARPNDLQIIASINPP